MRGVALEGAVCIQLGKLCGDMYELGFRVIAMPGMPSICFFHSGSVSLIFLRFSVSVPFPISALSHGMCFPGHTSDELRCFDIYHCLMCIECVMNLRHQASD